MLKRYNYDQLNELCNKISLLEYAEKTLDFKKKGNKYFCSCPKHSDSDPSLCISPDVNLFYCFSCGRKGNLINWLMEYEDLDFYSAVQKVAKLTNSDISNYTESETLSFYKYLNKLNTSQSHQVTKHEERRILDLKKDYEDKYLLESPQEWLDEGISEEELRKYNIRIDPSSNRIVYPVYSNDDVLISVKGRTRFQNYKELKIMKYMNYYSLGGIVDYFQGMQQARDYIKQSNEIIIVEGIKSVMKIDGWGYHNVVASETSVINEYQVELLIKMGIKNIVIGFDKDVSLSKIKEHTNLLQRFTNVFVIYDKTNLLKPKDSPCDEGKEVWKYLYKNKKILT